MMVCYEYSNNSYRIIEYPSRCGVLGEYQIIVDIFNIIKNEYEKIIEDLLKK